MNIKVYYINLDRSPERKEFMDEQFKMFGIVASRIVAIDGIKLEPEYVDNVTNKQNFMAHFMAPKVGEIGAFLSHKLSWDTISTQEEDFALVIEDDIKVDKKLFKDLDVILENITSNDIVDVSGRLGFITNDKKELNGDIELTKYSTPPLGMTGKIIGKDAAKKLSRVFPEYLAPVDIMVQKIYQHQIPIWSVNKEYLSHVDQQVGGTTIQTKDMKLSGKIVRELKRPLWRLGIKIANLIK